MVDTWLVPQVLQYSDSRGLIFKENKASDSKCSILLPGLLVEMVLGGDKSNNIVP